MTPEEFKKKLLESQYEPTEARHEAYEVGIDWARPGGQGSGFWGLQPNGERHYPLNQSEFSTLRTKEATGRHSLFIVDEAKKIPDWVMGIKEDTNE